MNYLAHSFLSPGSDEILVGNMIGDFVKGRPGPEHSQDIRAGIRLHRAIDGFTDSHPVVKRSKLRLDTRYRRFAGIIIDMFYDHFLAKNWGEYSSVGLKKHTVHVYAALERCRDELPERFKRILPYMIGDNWLASYRSTAHTAGALRGISRRLSFENPIGSSIGELLKHYEEFEIDFGEFFDELIAFVYNQPLEEGSR